MAESEHREGRKSRRLPPISGGGDGNEPGEEKKPKRRRRPRSTDAVEDPGDEEQSRRRPRRRRPESAAPSQTGTVEDADPSGSRTELIPEGEAQPSRPRKKRKKRRRPAPEGEEEAEQNAYDRDYAELAEDIVADDNDPSNEAEAGVAGDKRDEEPEVRFHRTEPTLRSQAVDRLFIEGKSRFRSEDKIKYEQKLQAEKEAVPEKIDEGPSNLTLEFALSVSRHFRRFSLFCHGPFAGVGILHCIFIWSLASSIDRLLLNYAYMARYFSIAYYLLFTVCTVSVCIRNDIGRPTRNSCVKCWTMQSGALAVLFYFVGFILSNYMYSTEYFIHMHTINSTYWNSLTNKQSMIDTWKAMDVARCVFICLGWLIISFTPVHDRLRDNLRAGIEEFLNDDHELVEVKSTKA